MAKEVQWFPYSQRQKQLLTWWAPGSPYCDYDTVLAEGAVRSGKTHAGIHGYLTWSTANFQEEDFIVASRSMGALQRNVIKPMKMICKAMGWPHHHHRGDPQYLKVGTNTHWLFGATTEASQDVVQGLTAAGAILDDAALFPESFVQQAKARCSVDGAKMWLNCNPEGPFHWMKKEYIDQAEATRTLVLHFLMSDNLSLSDAVRARYERMFKGVWYKRFIQGLWVMAEGSVYDMWDSAKHMVSIPPELLPARRVASIDYATSSIFTAGLYAVSKPSEKRAHLMREYRYDAQKEKKQKTDSQLADAFVEFLGDESPLVVYVDPSAASFKAELNGRGFVVADGNNDVLDGIRLVATMMAQGSYTIDPSCTFHDQCYSSYVWDIKAQQRGEDKPLKVMDHEADATRYCLATYFGQSSLFGETDI